MSFMGLTGGWVNNVHLHCLTYMMLRCCTSSCTSSHTWCYATVCRLALPHIYDATLVYVSLAQWQDLDVCSRLAVEMGKHFPQKPLQAHLQKCEGHLAQKKRECRWGFLHIQWKVRAYILFKEIELWERCKTTVICGMKSMTNTANVENAGSINNPPGSISSGITSHINNYSYHIISLIYISIYIEREINHVELSYVFDLIQSHHISLMSLTHRNHGAGRLMLTWLGYIDGIHVTTIFLAAPWIRPGL